MRPETFTKRPADGFNERLVGVFSEKGLEAVHFDWSSNVEKVRVGRDGVDGRLVLIFFSRDRLYGFCGK